MLKTVALVALSSLIAVGGGAASVLYALDRTEGFGAVEIGPWVAHPTLGTPDADPYARVRYARAGRLGLGRAEGIAFHAQTDSSGAAIRSGCTYVVAGMTPPGRFWTLHGADASRVPLPAVGARRPATSSRAIIREPDGSFSIALGPDPLPGNWLPVAPARAVPWQIVLTVYDTPVGGSGDVSAAVLPEIRRTACRE